MPLPELPPVLQTDTLPPLREARPLKELVIAWTGAIRGELMACGCPTVPYGGLARRAELIERLNAQHIPVFTLDAGEMLVKGTRGEDPSRVSRARAVLAAMRAGGLDLWSPSSVDVGVGLSADVLGATVGEGALVSVVERQGVRVGVVGVPILENADLIARINKEKSSIEVDIWVALVHGGGQVAREVAENVEGLGLVLSTAGEATEPVTLTSGAPILEVPDRGRYVSVVRVFVGSIPGAVWVPEQTSGVWERVDRLWREGIEGKVGVAEEVAKLRGDLEKAVLGRNIAMVWDRALGSDLDENRGGESAKVTSMIARYQEERVVAARAASQQSVEVRYAGAGGCVSCHRDRFAAWSFDPHSKALLALMERGQDKNAECVGCHTTGWGEKGGFGELNEDSLEKFKGVQCEACHGPLAGHPNNGATSTPISEATCTVCHDAANSPQFDYVRYLSRISCKK